METSMIEAFVYVLQHVLENAAGIDQLEDDLPYIVKKYNFDDEDDGSDNVS